MAGGPRRGGNGGLLHRPKVCEEVDRLCNLCFEVDVARATSGSAAVKVVGTSDPEGVSPGNSGGRIPVWKYQEGRVM